MAKLAASASFALFAHSCPGPGAWACSTGSDREFCSGRSLLNCSNALSPPRLGLGVEPPLERGSFRRSGPVPFLKVGCRRLTPNLEHVTCSEPTVTPINPAISSRLLPRSTRFLICCTRSGVNFSCLPRSDPFFDPVCIFLPRAVVALIAELGKHHPLACELRYCPTA